MTPWCTKDQLTAITREHDKMRAALREFQRETGTIEEKAKPVKEKRRNGHHLECTCYDCGVIDWTAILTEVASKGKTLTPEGVHFAKSQRVSGELRSRYLDHLRTCYGDERLDLAELEARMREVMSAATEAELKLLICDLPSLPLPPVKTVPDVIEQKECNVSMAFGVAAVFMFIIAILSSFTLHTSAEQAAFILSVIFTGLFGLLSFLNR